MKAIFKLAGVLAFLFAVCVSVNAQNRMFFNPGREIRIAALCKNDVWDSYIKGIQSAVDATGMGDRVKVKDCMYLDERQGLKKLVELLETGEVHIVLGPTDSGIYSRALERREELETYKIPVVSPLVTATAENEPDGWFFRTNVDVGRRVLAIHNYLNKCLIRSITILYADTEFGRRAQETFKKYLQENQKENYRAMPFKVFEDELFGVEQILDSRPEAVGVFGSNEDMASIYYLLQWMNHAGVSYRPFHFAITDARRIADEVDDLYFVSVAKCDTTVTADDTAAAEASDEVEDLAYDTCLLLLNQLKRMPSGLFDPQQFRDRFAALLRGPHEDCGPKTGMTFHDYSNSSPPRVFHLQNRRVEQVNLAQVIKWPEKLTIKWELIKRRYGWLPLFNGLLLLVVVAAVSILDIKRWYGKGLIKEWRRPLLYLVSLVNFLVVFILYIFLTEKGIIRYDDVMAALFTAIAPLAVLRTTLFETPAGSNIAQLYDKFFLWVNDKLMIGKYRSQSGNVNVIAYYNSISDMRSMLRQIYKNAKTEAQQIQLERELEEKLEKVKSILGKRRTLARLLLNRLDWEELRQKNLVPDVKEFSDKNPIDPEIVIRESARHCSQEPERSADVRTALNAYMQKVKKDNPQSYNETQQELKQVLRDAESERDRLFILIRFLFIHFGFNIESLKNKSLLPNDFSLHRTCSTGFSHRG